MLERVLVALLAGGHVLLEGVPGLAKTLTVRTLAAVLGGSFSRVQFTPDLVPADLVGTRIWQPDRGEFRTELGPVFANLLLADEINRAPAKVQSALLEVMQEHQVTIGGTTYDVPEPFLVLATQNPIESEGTYALPEAQVDRFLFKLLVDYPTVEDEVAVVEPRRQAPREPREVLAGRRPARASARAGRAGVRRPHRDRLRRAPGRRHAPPRAPRPRRARRPDRVRRQPARARSAWSRRPRRSPCCAAAPTSTTDRRARPVARRAAPPARARPTTRWPTACSPTRCCDRVLEAVAAPPARTPLAGGRVTRRLRLVVPRGPPGPGQAAGGRGRPLDLVVASAPRGVLPGEHRRRASARAPSSRSCGRTSRRRRAAARPGGQRAHGRSRTSASRSPSGR